MIYAHFAALAGDLDDGLFGSKLPWRGRDASLLAASVPNRPPYGNLGNSNTATRLPNSRERLPSQVFADQKAGIAVLISADPVDGIISSESGASRAATTLERVMSTDLGRHFVTEPGAKR